MAKIKCLYPGCKSVVDKSVANRCPKHADTGGRSPTTEKRLEHQYDIAGRRIYSTKRWRVISTKKRTVDPFCEDCLDKDRETLADVVDHIVEIKDDKSLCYTWSNLRSLCHKCHNRKTAREQRVRHQNLVTKKKRLFNL